MPSRSIRALALAALLSGSLALAQSAPRTPASSADAEPRSPDGKRYRAQPLVKDLFFADPSAHVFGGRIYVYASHDVDAGIPDDDLGNQYAMHDYRVLSMDRIGGPVTVHPVALDVKQIPWASKQTWAPDAAYRNGTYYLYFPARDKAGVFRIGVATSRSPTGPFTAQAQPIRGSFSIDPAVFTDDDGASYMYFGGIWGGQLQRWQGNRYDPAAGDTDLRQDDRPAIAPRVARMRADMTQFAESPRPVVITDAAGKPIPGGDHERRFFEAAWVFKRAGTYYFTYSTGDTHFLNYATGTSPYGPFRYRGHILSPVQGWTTHHSIVPFQGAWWLFYHDTQLSNKNHLRSAKVTQLTFTADGSIRAIDPFRD